MKFVPHDYQTFAVNHILKNEVAALLLDMGLGKTAITLTAIERLMYQELEIRKVLIVAPLRVAKNTWPAEIQKWDHLQGLTWSVITGTHQERMAALRKKADIYIVNRENVQWLVDSSGMPFDFDMLVLDELSSFKSWQAKRFKSLMAVRPFVKRVVGLTGTPTSNGLMDLFAEFKLLDMGQRLGRFIGQYRNAFFRPDRVNGPIVYTYKPLPGAEEEIYRRISDITISMKACGHLKMPELIINKVPVTLDPDEREVYDSFRKDLVAEVKDTEINAANAAVLSGKLLQMASGAIYDEERNVLPIHERKLDCLEDLIEAANGKPMLIAYWFQHDADRIKKRFDVREIKTSKDIEDWNAGRVPVALIHPASAGHGLNLQAGGSTLVWFSLTWSLELYQQTNARLYRQGQENTVVIHHIIATDTIDERVMKALEHKDKTQEALIAAVRAEVKV